MQYQLAISSDEGEGSPYSVLINNATHIPQIGEYIKLIDSRNTCEERKEQTFQVTCVMSGAKATEDKSKKYNLEQFNEDDLPTVHAEPARCPYDRA